MYIRMLSKNLCGFKYARYTENDGSIFNRLSASADAGGMGAVAVYVGI